ncbi:MAG: class I tRNA ligase family protein [Candidatus Micrarchaeota archaeon]|nr:class I tRNA ligase family protein [Candidatus Micrarchaeota archaeon]
MLRVYNSLTKKVEPFLPKKPKQVKIYTCGPTVYARPHIGNFRTYVWEDIFKRYLIYSGFEVVHVMNITDFDNSVVKEALKKGCNCRQIAAKYEKLFRKDAEMLGILPADIYPHVTQYIDKMADWAIQLQRKKLAYQEKDGKVFFDISKYPKYGELSGERISSTGKKVVAEEYKRWQAGDFLIWAPCEKDGKQKRFCFKSKLGLAYPPWNLHCAVMSFETLGKGIDVAMGGKDNIFNHHENTRAIVEALKGEYARYWIHIRHLIINGKKMSKSKGNVVYLPDLLKKGFEPKQIRFLLLLKHYRERLNFSWKFAKRAKEKWLHIKKMIDALRRNEGGKFNPYVDKQINRLKEEFEKKMDDNLDAKGAIETIESFLEECARQEMSKTQASRACKLLKKLDFALAVLPL